MEKLNPYSDKVIIEPLATEERTSGGIIRSDIDKRQYKIGTVVSSGPGFYTISGELIKTQTIPGDVVVYPKNLAIDYYHFGKKYVVVREGELLMKITKENGK